MLSCWEPVLLSHHTRHHAADNAKSNDLRTLAAKPTADTCTMLQGAVQAGSPGRRWG